MPLASLTADGADHLSTLRRLVAARWLLIGLALTVCLAAPAVLGVTLPLFPMAAIIGLMAAMNGLNQWRLAQGREVGAGDIFSMLVFDTASLAALIFFSGGVTNPMIALLLPPVAIAALTLPGRRAAAVCGLAIAAYSLLLLIYLPLPMDDPARATRLHLFGMWLGFVLSALLVAWFIVRMTAMIRQRDGELVRAREQALRDERVLALGTLAAGAAHELGTPLGTMALITGELARDKELPAPVQEDIALLRQQIAACKEIITGLSRRAGAERLENIALVPVTDWLTDLRMRWHALRPGSQSRLAFDLPEPPPVIAADPRLEQAIYNLLDNAARAVGEGGAPIDVQVAGNEACVSLTIRDRGPGFPNYILALAGRKEAWPHAQGQGVGLMLTRAAVEQLGGSLYLSNAEDGGAVVRIELPLGGGA